MSKETFLKAIEKYNAQQFLEFLKINDLTEFENIVSIKNLDGYTFMNLSEYEINSWTPFIGPHQTERFSTLLSSIKRYPENLTYLNIKPVAPTKPTIDKSKLQILSQNESFIHSLRAAVQSRHSNKQLQPKEDASQQIKPASPARPPTFKKPNLLKAKFDDPSTNDSFDDDDLYEAPNEEEEARVKNLQEIQKINRVLPELPITQRKFKEPPADDPPPESSFYVDLDTEMQQKSPRKPFTLQQHYTKQREMEREKERQKENEKARSKETELRKSPNLIGKPQIQSNPLPPIPTLQRELFSRVQRPESLNPLPRPPTAWPAVKVSELPSSPDTPLPVPMEQESYYRYTDRKGAEDLLSTEFADGTYLIRPSTSYHSTLSVRQGEKVYHIGIKKVGNLLEMESLGLNLQFNNLNEVIDYFKVHPLTVRNRYNVIVDIHLRGTLPANRT